jgi:hypothetical protein
MSELCSKCQQAWREYAESIKAHVDVVQRCYEAALGGDSAALMRAEHMEQLVLRSRHDARRGLMDHQVAHLIEELEERQTGDEFALGAQ